MIRRPPRSTQGVSSAASDVYKRQVHGTLKSIGSLMPQEDVAVYSLDGNNLKDNHLEFHMSISKTLAYKCNSFQKLLKPDELSEDLLKFTLFDEDEKVARKKGIMDELIIQANFRPFNQLANSYENFELREKLLEHSHSKKLTLFAKQVIVNKTEFEIKFKGEKMPKYRLKPHASCLFGIPQGVKVGFSTKGYQWCKPMQVTTVGITGAFTLCLLYTSPSPRDLSTSRMPSSA
eukprot:TRINITY_DN28813_c0_g1_i1.p1 TRINITY_DN28813_c0_g1~~TRINITY_DN28813_c0_g1_i1.p1  ORF type:complete len:233 (-),score=43.46 TRINITY_DN28813_c0_g1_i1:110-808(-)